jgi:hypothetical protein
MDTQSIPLPSVPTLVEPWPAQDLHERNILLAAWLITHFHDAGHFPTNLVPGVAYDLNGGIVQQGGGTADILLSEAFGPKGQQQRLSRFDWAELARRLKAVGWLVAIHKSDDGDFLRVVHPDAMLPGEVYP